MTDRRVRTARGKNKEAYPAARSGAEGEASVVFLRKGKYKKPAQPANSSPS